jgi:hypothetical protein
VAQHDAEQRERAGRQLENLRGIDVLEECLKYLSIAVEEGNLIAQRLKHFLDFGRQ